MLAFNASIEAARAGEAGKNFSVVAHETMKLAEETLISTNEINEKVQLIIKLTEGAVTSMSETEAIVNKNNLAVKETEEISASSEEVSASTEEQLSNMEYLFERVTHLKDMSEKLKDEISVFKI